MTQRNWMGNSGTFSAPGNWDTGVPGTADTAAFNAGTYTVTLDSTASIDAMFAGSTSTFDLTTGALTLIGATNISFWNGLFVQSGGALSVTSGAFTVNGTLTQSAGTVTLGTGVRLILQNSASLHGTIGGAGGTLAVGGAVSLNSASLAFGALVMGSTGMLTLGSDESFAGDDMISGGSLVLGAHTLTLTGDSTQTGGQIFGPGVLAADGTLNLSSVAFRGSGTLLDAGLINDDTGLVLGGGSSSDTTTLLITPSGTYDLLTDRAVSAQTGTDVIINQGLLEKTVATFGARGSLGPSLSNTGTLRISTGTLLLNGTANSLDGRIDGGGTVLVGGTATLQPSVTLAALTTLGTGGGGLLTLGGSGNTYSPAGNMSVASNSTLALNGNSLTLQGGGSLDGTIVAAGGSLFIGGRYNLNLTTFTGGTLWLEDLGEITQSGGINLGLANSDHVAFQIDKGASYIVTSPGSGKIFTANNGTTLAAAILNNGVFDYAGGFGSNFNIDTAFANNIGGTILVPMGNVAWTQSFINDGTGLVSGIASFAAGIQTSTFNVGTLGIGNGGTISVTGTVNAASTIDFQGQGVLRINSPALFNGAIGHLSAGDTVDFVNAHFNTYSRDPAAGLMSVFNVVNGVTLLEADFHLAAQPGTIWITSDGNGGTDLIATDPNHIFNDSSITPLQSSQFSLPSGTTVGNFNGAFWNNGVPGQFTDATVATSGGTIIVSSTNTVDSLNGSGTTLDLTGGRLLVNNGGAWGNTALLTGGVFDSVTGYKFSGATTSLGSSAVMQSDSGTLTVNGTFFAGGTLLGTGAIGMSSGTFEMGGVVSVATIAIGAATFDPFGGETLTSTVVLTNSTLPLFGSPVTFNGNVQLNATVPDTGTVVIGAAADLSNFAMNGTNDLVTVLGTVFQTSGDVGQSGTGGEIDVSSGAVWNIEADNGVFLDAGANKLVNNGLFEKTGGVGTTRLQGRITSNATLMVDTGTVTLQSGAIELGGTVGGSGVLQTGSGSGSTTATLDAGLFINVGSLITGTTFLGGDQNYLGAINTSQTLALQGHTFTLGNQAELTGFISGPGEVSLTRYGDVNGLTVQGNGATLAVGDASVFAATVTQSNDLVLGGSTADHANLAIAAGKTYEIMGDFGVFGTFSGVVVGTIVNAGTLAKLGGLSGGNSAIQAAVVNTGTVLVQHGNMTLQTAATNDGVFAVTGGLTLNAALNADAGLTGTIALAPTGTLVANANIGASEFITYDPGGLVVINNGVSFGATIEGFGPGDTLELKSAIATGVNYAGGVITLSNGGTTLQAINMPGLGNPAGLTVNSDGQGNSYLVELACFTEGTRILTAAGEVPVERLRVGDLVPGLVSGGLRRIRWIGSREIDCARHPEPAKVNPVRVRAGALGAGVPSRDVLLSRDHALAIGGSLIPVRHLIDGNCIVQEPAETVTYWHIELDTHDVVLADGLAAESYLDSGNRAAFGGGMTRRLHADFARRVWEAGACLPLVCTGSQIATILR